MARVRLAINGPDLAGAIAFSPKPFGTGPAKVRPGYATLAVVDPPLKVVLIEDKVRVDGPGCSASPAGPGSGRVLLSARRAVDSRWSAA